MAMDFGNGRRQDIFSSSRSNGQFWLVLAGFSPVKSWTELSSHSAYAKPALRLFKILKAADVDLVVITGGTPGFSGLSNLVNVERKGVKVLYFARKDEFHVETIPSSKPALLRWRFKDVNGGQRFYSTIFGQRVSSLTT
ncbi:hypothetical protein HanPSC8_Chr13g0548791 [Helianthus annuus]|nr:hypothetical protein HanPSC8_Chr13g0548791 [Helianthus annuus]